MSTYEDLLEETEVRRRIAQALGSPADRRAARRRLGLTIAEVAAACGLSYSAVRRRETDEWKFSRDSIESEPGLNYIRFIARARGVKL